MKSQIDSTCGDMKNSDVRESQFNCMYKLRQIWNGGVIYTLLEFKGENEFLKEF